MKKVFLFLLIALLLSTAGVAYASLMEGDVNGGDTGGYDPDTPTEFPAGEEEDFTPVIPSDVFENPEEYNTEELFNDLPPEEQENFWDDYLSSERIDEGLDRMFEEDFGVDPEEVRRAAREQGVTPSTGMIGTVGSGRTGCPTEGLVPCGTPGCPCTFCDLFVMFSRIVNYVLFRIVPLAAAFMIAIGGFMFILAYSGKGGPDTLSKARTLFKSVAIGLILIYAAWLIVNAFFWVIGVNTWTGLREGWWKIECESNSSSYRIEKETNLLSCAPITQLEE